MGYTPRLSGAEGPPRLQLSQGCERTEVLEMHVPFSFRTLGSSAWCPVVACREGCVFTVSPRIREPLGRKWGFSFNHEKPTLMLCDGGPWCLDQTHRTEPGPSLTRVSALVMLEPQPELSPGRRRTGQPRALTSQLLRSRETAFRLRLLVRLSSSALQRNRPGHTSLGRLGPPKRSPDAL